jgi:hypothetical protein
VHREDAVGQRDRIAAQEETAGRAVKGNRADPKVDEIVGCEQIRGGNEEQIIAIRGGSRGVPISSRRPVPAGRSASPLFDGSPGGVDAENQPENEEPRKAAGRLEAR